ncbi:hypothetical protein KSF_098980 [Reticulibacter mediterranei]|uniref:Uncharacterized protein n=1 Tax=Reticulibacter mediterranei TaxID=2778369 RepID=A0A8J3N8S6_9CHLR|nr:hypothetical protein KSF_098980 [Reticulibacter mediterranei]
MAKFEPIMRCRECLHGNHEACNGYVAKEGMLQRKMECTCKKRGHKFDEQAPCQFCSINQHGKCEGDGCFCKSKTCKSGGPKREWSRSGQQKACGPCAKGKHKKCEKRSCSCMKEWNCGGNH